MNKKIDTDKNIVMELLRFIIIGGYSTLIDFAIEGWVTSMLSKFTVGLGHVAAFFVMFAISIVGFIVSTPATWSLSSVWGFRNVDRESEAKAKSAKGGLIFAFWSFLALLGGALIQFLGYMICLDWSGMNINILGGFDFNMMFTEGHLEVFWAWFIVLVIRTSFTMVFNYLTRKFFIYKAPKETESK